MNRQGEVGEFGSGDSEFGSGTRRRTDELWRGKDAEVGGGPPASPERLAMAGRETSKANKC